MAASFTSFTGQPNADLKLKPTQPLPRLRGSATGRFRRTGPGKPIETASYFQSPITFFTPATICWAVRVGPDTNFRGSRSPLTSTLTCVPPTSTTSTFIRLFRRQRALCRVNSSPYLSAGSGTEFSSPQEAAPANPAGVTTTWTGMRPISSAKRPLRLKRCMKSGSFITRRVCTATPPAM